MELPSLHCMLGKPLHFGFARHGSREVRQCEMSQTTEIVLEFRKARQCETYTCEKISKFRMLTPTEAHIYTRVKQ